MSAPIQVTTEILVLASHNRGKLGEIAEILAPCGVGVKSASAFSLPAPDETGETYEANAAIKARAAAKATGFPALADDSGFEVTAIGNAPGIHAADWAETGDGEGRDFIAAMQCVHDKVIASGSDETACRFVSVLALVLPSGEEIFARGEVTGEMTWPPRGGNGFGYDPMFIPAGYKETFAEMGGAEKQAISHRRRALEDLLSRVRFTAP